MTPLTHLGLDDSGLADLPESLSQLDSLELITLSGNPLRSRLAEIAREGTDAVSASCFVPVRYATLMPLIKRPVGQQQPGQRLALPGGQPDREISSAGVLRGEGPQQVILSGAQPVRKARGGASLSSAPAMSWAVTVLQPAADDVRR